MNQVSQSLTHYFVDVMITRSFINTTITMQPLKDDVIWPLQMSKIIITQ